MPPSVKFALAQLDPFDASVAGAKVPDSNCQPSISTTDIEQFSLTSSAVATDLQGRAYRPSYTWAVVNGTAGGAVNWGAAWNTTVANRAKRGAYIAAIELSRPVAHAIRLSSQLSPTTASGFVHIGISTESHYGVATWQYPTTVAEISGLQFYKRVTLASLTQSPLTVINKYIDDTAFRYSASNIDTGTATTMTFHTDQSWGAIVVIVEGAPVNSVILSAEHLLISEGIPDKNGPILGTPAATNSPGVLTAVSEMSTNTEPAHTEADQQGYITRGGNVLVNAAREQGEAVFNAVGVPILQHMGRTGVNMAAQQFYNMVTGTGGIGGINSNPHRLEN